MQIRGLTTDRPNHTVPFGLPAPPPEPALLDSVLLSPLLQSDLPPFRGAPFLTLPLGTLPNLSQAPPPEPPPFPPATNPRPNQDDDGPGVGGGYPPQNLLANDQDGDGPGLGGGYFTYPFPSAALITPASAFPIPWMTPPVGPVKPLQVAESSPVRLTWELPEPN